MSCYIPIPEPRPERHQEKKNHGMSLGFVCAYTFFFLLAQGAARRRFSDSEAIPPTPRRVLFLQIVIHFFFTLLQDIDQ